MDDRMWLRELSRTERKTVKKMWLFARRVDHPLRYEWWHGMIGTVWTALGYMIYQHLLRTDDAVMFTFMTLGLSVSLFCMMDSHPLPGSRKAVAAEQLLELVSQHPDLYERLWLHEPNAYWSTEELESYSRRTPEP